MTSTTRKEVGQIVKELEEGLRLRYWMLEDFIPWWNARIVEFGFVSVADLLECCNHMMVIDEMEIKPEYHKYGFVRHIWETKNFEPKKGIGGNFIFKFIAPPIVELDDICSYVLREMKLRKTNEEWP